MPTKLTGHQGGGPLPDNDQGPAFPDSADGHSADGEAVAREREARKERRRLERERQRHAVEARRHERPVIRTRLITTSTIANRVSESSSDREAGDTIKFSAETPTRRVRVELDVDGTLRVHTTELAAGEWVAGDGLHFHPGPIGARQP